jgi:hypothetical protein
MREILFAEGKELGWYKQQQQQQQCKFQRVNNKRKIKNIFAAKIKFIFFCSFQSASPRWEPQISVLCEAGQTYLPQYLSEDGRWASELSVKVPGVSCLRDKVDLLDYCKKVS